MLSQSVNGCGIAATNHSKPKDYVAENELQITFNDAIDFHLKYYCSSVTDIFQPLLKSVTYGAYQKLSKTRKLIFKPISFYMATSYSGHRFLQVYGAI